MCEPGQETAVLSCCARGATIEEGVPCGGDVAEWRVEHLPGGLEPACCAFGSAPVSGARQRPSLGWSEFGSSGDRAMPQCCEQREGTASR